jgi:C2 domain
LLNQTVNCAIEHYCDAIAASPKLETTATLMAQAQSLLGGSNAPQDIEHTSCVKLRNVGFAMITLKEMYRLMNGAAISKTVKEHRKNTTGKSNDGSDADAATGAFRVFVSYAENIKPINKNGMSNPYVIIRVPDGTVVPAENENTSPMNTPKNGNPKDDVAKPEPTVLTGSACELVKYTFTNSRTRSIPDTVNPTFDDTFQVILPPITHLEVAVFSRNLLTADEVAGTAVIDLSPGTRLRRKLRDNQTHDVYVELEPQGRLLLRLTMEGEQEDVDFWFRRTNERLIRVRDDLLRSLTAKVLPYTKEIISKCFKDNEAAPLPSKSYFSSLMSSVEYSDLTADGKSINSQVSELEADDALGPLIQYLDKNLQTLCASLSPVMAQEVIKRTWEESVIVIEQLLLPPLFGTIDPARKLLTRRQLSMASQCLKILYEFFHADGEGLGLSPQVLEIPLYVLLTKDIIKSYYAGIDRLKRDYELSVLAGKEKEHLLRLIRMHFAKDHQLEDKKEWLEIALRKRKESGRR